MGQKKKTNKQMISNLFILFYKLRIHYLTICFFADHVLCGNITHNVCFWLFVTGFFDIENKFLKTKNYARRTGKKFVHVDLI
jgi:hypothetical protein